MIGDPVTVVKLCCDYVTFCRIRRMLTGHEFGLSSQYGNVPLTLQCLQVVRNWQMPSNTVISVAPLNFSLYILNGVELLHNLPTLFTCTHVHYTHTTCCSCKWYLLSSLMWASSSTVFCWRKTSSCWRFSASLRYGQTSVGKGEEWVRGGRSI